MRKRLRAESREGMVVTTVALREAALRRLALIAAERRTVMTELVRRAVDQWLARHDRDTRGRGAAPPGRGRNGDAPPSRAT